MAEEAGDERLKATLVNHEGRREYICRKLGVVSDGDVRRLRSRLEARRAGK